MTRQSQLRVLSKW